MLVRLAKVPFKLVAREGRPLIVEVIIRNTSGERRGYEVVAEAEGVSFSQSGLAKYFTKRVEIPKGGEGVVRIKVFARPTTTPGEYLVSVAVRECSVDYATVYSEKRLQTKVPVI